MKSKILASWAMSLMSMVLAIACSSPEKETTQNDEIQTSALAGSLYTTIVFKEGDANLSEADQKELSKLTEKAQGKKKAIEEIKILAWADREYPEKTNQKASIKEVTLASERAFKIRDYLESHLKELEDIDSYNMAKRPGLISQLFKNNEYAIKEVFEDSDATATKLPDGTVSYTKASKALVIIQYEGDTNNF
jgi:hypothetical protein